MLFVWISLWTIAFILWIADWSRVSTRFAGAMALAGGFGGLAASLDEWFLDTTIPPSLHLLEIASSFITQVGVPYFFLLFCLASNPFLISKSLLRTLSLITAIPPFIIWYLTPFYPTYTYDFRLSLIWIGPYILIGSALLIHSWLREKNPAFKRVRLFTNMITIAPVVFNFFSSNVLRSLEFDSSYWKLNAFIIPVIFVFFIVFAIRYGVLGIQLRVERYRLDSTIRAVTSGASILNHSIKNELLKIEILLNRIRQNPQVQGQPDCQRDFQHVSDSIEHMNRMVERIQAQTKEIVVQKDRHSVHEIVSQAIRGVAGLDSGQKIAIRHDIPTDTYISCDRTHVGELLNNLLMNAFEATAGKGSIRISLQETKSETIITVEDTGCGIPPEQLTAVLEPFYSTKKTKTNFGLGLSYCFQVMQKHDGLLNIYSEVGKGTTVFLHFPKMKTSFLERVLTFAKNKTAAH